MFKLIKKIFIIVLIIIGLFFSYLMVSGYQGYEHSLEKDPLKEKIAEIQSKDTYVKLDDISSYLPKAVVAIEDKRFFEHGAIDFIGLTRALVTDITTGKALQGGSTLTQQLAKNLYFMDDRNMSRKISEAFMAHKLEETYSKKEILELYLNVVYFGDNNYGVYEASVNYFNTYPKYLTLAQASMLAGLPQAPSIYALNNYNKSSYERRNQVLKAMLDQKMITKEQYKNANNTVVYY